MCVVERDGKVVITDQSNEIDSLVIGLENAVQAVRLSCDKIGGLRLRIMELEAQVATLQEIAITEKAYHIYYRCQGDCGRCVCSAGAHKKDARRQLVEEHPKLFQQIGE